MDSDFDHCSRITFLIASLLSKINSKAKKMFVERPLPSSKRAEVIWNVQSAATLLNGTCRDSRTFLSTPKRHCSVAFTWFVLCLQGYVVYCRPQRPPQSIEQLRWEDRDFCKCEFICSPVHSCLHSTSERHRRVSCDVKDRSAEDSKTFLSCSGWKSGLILLAQSDGCWHKSYAQTVGTAFHFLFIWYYWLLQVGVEQLPGGVAQAVWTVRKEDHCDARG